MAEMTSGTPLEEVTENELDANRTRVDEDLKIMEDHAAELSEVEQDIQESMRKKDREYKDSHFHSVPKGRKHQR